MARAERVHGRLPLILCGMAAICLSTYVWPADAQEVPVELVCQVSCATNEARLGLTHIVFLNGRVDPNNARLECTVYKNGFEIGGYAAFSPLVPDLEVRPQPVRRDIGQLRPFQIQIVDVQSAPDEQFITGLTNCRCRTWPQLQLASAATARRKLADERRCHVSGASLYPRCGASRVKANNRRCCMHVPILCLAFIALSEPEAGAFDATFTDINPDVSSLDAQPHGVMLLAVGLMAWQLTQTMRRPTMLPANGAEFIKAMTLVEPGSIWMGMCRRPRGTSKSIQATETAYTLLPSTMVVWSASRA